MRLLKTISELRVYRRSIEKPIALVPTMGALHAGHLSLIEAAKRLSDEVWVTIFVNPTQFGPNEDLSKYPRPLEDDLAACEKLGVTAVFNPEPEVVYPPSVIPMELDVPSLTGAFEGAHRPGHFAGVCRVVLKLFNLCQPRYACFGQKDYQQLRVIEAMVQDLNLPIAIQRVATMREADGLAMSSRNRYLGEDARKHAVGLYKALNLAKHLIESDGETDPAIIERAMEQSLVAHKIEPDYCAIRHPDTLDALDMVCPPIVALIAGRLDGVRLLDNLII
ncbi:MAG: pantoate--beta-alanine ligase [Phycisphaeraceae bacterium]